MHNNIWSDPNTTPDDHAIHVTRTGDSYPVLIFCLIIFLLALHAAPIYAMDRPLPLSCTYEVGVWNVNQKRSVDVKTINHSYSALAPEEIDTLTGCTVCKEDQSVIDIPPLPVFSVCHKIAPGINALISDLTRNGSPIFSIIGYHVIKSRGPVDKDGNRTGFSNHSYGTAIDINPEQNGLYDNCVQFGPECRLLRGGPWRPGLSGTLDKNSEIVLKLKREGFHWGGEIAGKQKDFMHFSLTGY